MNDAKLIVWNEQLATGSAEIDGQHQILVNTLNEANIRLTDESPLDLLEQITKDLLSYALYHFETEERLMQESAYGERRPQEAQTHFEQHRNFSAKVVEVRNQIKAGTRIPRDDLLAFLNNWLINHIMNTDKRLGEYLAAHHSQA
ncbi:MAG: hemerythrin family protein [Alphaproteobacteria bacterium]|nr:hemerythrin family protein [Alphaproteobacteria bacterium]